MRRLRAHLLALIILTSLTGLSAFVLLAPASAAKKANSPFFGVTVPSHAAFRRDTAEFGHLPMVHTYYDGLPSADAWTRGLSGIAKSAVIVSFNAQPSAVLSGHDDKVLSHFFDTAPAGRTIYYSYVHEPESQIEHGQFSAASYRAAWAHVVRLADDAHKPNLHSMLILTAYDLKPGAHRNWKEYLPGGGIISTLGWDAYPSYGARKLVPPAQFMGPAVAASKAAGLPFGFAEFGVTDQKGRPAWLTKVGDYVISSGARFGVLFDSQPRGCPPLTLTDRPSIAAWRAVISRSANEPASPAGHRGVTAPVRPATARVPV
jgi:hypothetical protein